MAHLIDKSALVAEIERLVNNYDKALDYEAALEDVRNFIDTLEVKEVNEELVSSVWHDSNIEQPKDMSTVVIWDGSCGEVLTNCVKVNPDRIWAYMDDMLNKKEKPVSKKEG